MAPHPPLVYVVNSDGLYFKYENNPQLGTLKISKPNGEIQLTGMVGQMAPTKYMSVIFVLTGRQILRCLADILKYQVLLEL